MKLHQPNELVKTANEALELLKEGNKRFVEANLSEKVDYTEDRKVLTNEGQKPFAVILCCSDSRVAPEIYFDQKLGDLFVVRNAGNVVDETVLGSIEYAVEHLYSPLVVVVGHSHCGAVTAACGGGHLPPNIKTITDRIQKSINEGDDVDTVINRNVETMVKAVQEDDIVKEFKATVVGAHYDIETGKVVWL